MPPRRAVAPRRRQKLVALHHQVYLTLRNELIRGHYGGAGGRAAAALPAENDLAAEFKVSRVTIRRALAALEQEGLVVRRHGAGTFPAPMAGHLRRARDVEGLYDDLNELLGSYEREVLAFRRMKTPAFVLNQVEDFGVDCLHLSVLSKEGDTPVHLNFQYVPGRYAELLEPLPRGDGRLLLLLLLQDRGVRPGTIDLNISSTAADLATSTRLDVQVGIPLIAMRRISRDAQGAPLEYFEALTRPDRFTYSFRFGDRAR
jgi:GntR family transcriptional regulator